MPTEPQCQVPDCTSPARRWCDTCDAHASTYYCGGCDEWYDSDDGCSCPPTEDCQHCGCSQDEGSLVQVLRGASTPRWCDDCVSEAATWCDECGEYLANSHLCAHTRGATVERHNFNPTTLLFHHAPGESRDPARTEYVGLELEVAFNGQRERDALTTLTTLLDGDTDVYLKHDGSIANGRCGAGVELVTHPGTWLFWAQPEVRALWNYRLEQLRLAGFRSFDAQSCGLHFHVSRTLLTGTTLVRLQSLIYDNQTLFKRISQRRNFEYCSFDRADATDHRYRVCKAGSAKYSMRFRNFRYNPDENADRRVALNLPNDTPTVEFRFFRGTLHTPSFWKSFECVAACMEYARTQPQDAMLELPFLHWLAARAREYPHLVAYLQRWYASVFANPVHPRGAQTPRPQFTDMLVNRTNEPLIGV